MLLYGLVKYNCVRSVVIILVITFMQGNYKYIPETIRVSRVYSVAAVCIYNFCYMQCYFNREVRFVLLQ